MISLDKIPERFIMVDDDAISNILGQELVRRVCGNVEVQLFIDPAKALTYIQDNYKDPKKNIPTMLFLDLHTPNMTGWQFLEEYRKLSPSIHQQVSIFILSSTDDQGDLETAVANTLVSGLIVKPLSRAILQQLVTPK